MAKKGISKLSVMDFIKAVPKREKIISKASTNSLPSADSYKPNQIANALHPEKQFLKVSKIVEHSCDIKTFYLVPDAEKGTEKLAWFSAGQYLSINLTVGNATITRPYSISSSPRESLDGYYMLTIKRVKDGLASQYILDNWTVGTEVTASAPLGTFTYEPLRDAKTIIGIAGGSGITPFRSLAKAISDSDEDVSLTLLYGTRNLEEAIFQDEFVEIAKKCDKFRLVNVLSEENNESCESGFITAELINKYKPDGLYSIFMCGPQAMYDFVDKEIESLSLRRKFIRHELFGEFFNPSKEPDYPENVSSQFNITVSFNGTKQTVTADADTSILRTLEANGISVPAHCRSGECGWCHSKLISGEIYTPKSIDGRREADLLYGYIHPCCSFPLSDIEIQIHPTK